MPYKNKDEYNANQAVRRAKIRSTIECAKATPCLDCGIQYPTCVMQFDHVRGVKRFNIGSATALSPSLVTLKEEIAKCEVVCANCHAMRTEARKVASLVTNTP